jgi:hypothetical protein
MAAAVLGVWWERNIGQSSSGIPKDKIPRERGASGQRGIRTEGHQDREGIRTGRRLALQNKNKFLTEKKTFLMLNRK